MRNFGAVSPLFWTGRTGRSLRCERDAQVVALYLMTAPTSHQTGIYYLPVAYISNDTGIPLEGASKALARLIEGAFCLYDEAAEWIWVREMAVWQIGEPTNDADKRILGVQNYYASLPDLSFLPCFFERYEKIFHLKSRQKSAKNTKPLPSPSEGPYKPHGSHTQDQDQYQEQEKDQEGDARGRIARSARASTPPAAKPKAQKPQGGGFSPPTGLDMESWRKWVAYRAERKPAIKPVSMQDAAEELAKYGTDQAAVVRQSIAQGWQGLFPLKDKPRSQVREVDKITWRPPPDDESEPEKAHANG